MKVKNGQLMNVRRGLDELVELELRAKIAFKIRLLYEKVERQFEFYMKQKSELIEKAAKRNEDGTMKFVKDTQNIYIKEEFIEEVQELEETEGDDITPLSLAELEASGCPIKVSTLIRLGEMVVDDVP